jgi:hypothetical protein
MRRSIKQAAARLLAGSVCLLTALASQAVALPAPEEGSEVAALVGYATAVQLHIASNPARASAYLGFWHLLGEAGDPAELDEVTMQGIQAATATVAEASTTGARGARAPARWVDVLALSLEALAGTERPFGRPEALLATVDRQVAPRVLVNGRYEFAGALRGLAEFGFSPDVWLRCRQSASCIGAHDALFAEAMGGVSLAAGFNERVAADVRLREAPGFAHLSAGIVALDERLRAAPFGPAEAARAAADAYWEALGTGIAPALSGEGETKDPAELRALLELGRASAWLAESPTLATSFEIIGPPMLDVARLAGGGAASSAFLGAAAGVGLLFAGVHALALFDREPAVTPRELDRLVADMRESAYRNFVALRAESQLASNMIDTRLVRLGLALDVVKEDVGRIETAQRARVRADFLVQDARRWTAFEEENDRCFSLRSRDPATGRLKPADFRRCEERFLQGAVRRSQYATRARDFMLDARYLEAADLRFPFRHHYPMLLTLGGMESASALALSDPFEWQQNAAALLRLYQENPAGPSGHAPRREALRDLHAAGRRVHDALAGLALRHDDSGTPEFREAVHRQALEAYFAALRALIHRIGALDDPEADRHGKRLTVGLEQPLPTGRKRTVIEAVLSGAQDGRVALRPCDSAPDEAFLAAESDLLAEARRFFATPITAEELARSWNRDAITGFGLAPESHAALVPLPYLWTALDGHGEIEICLARFRPSVAEFTREEMPLRNHLRAKVEIDAAIEVRFTPGARLARELKLDPSRPPIVIARYASSRSCSFGYRMDEEGCSRGQCLAELAPQFWGAGSEASLNGGSCAGAPMPQRLQRDEQLASASELIDLGADLAGPYWRGRAAQLARLEADALRSTDFETASARYLSYFALAGITLGTWLDPGEPLAPLFAEDDPAAPRAVVAALLEGRRPPRAVAQELARHRAGVLEKVSARGREVAAPDALERLPHLAGLQEALSRIELMLKAYEASL